MVNQGLLVAQVQPGSIAEECEIEAGDRLCAVDGHHLRDLIDYSYYTAADQELLLEIEKPGGEVWELEIEREPGESLGLIFAPPAPAKCRNNCLFCFVHQLPRGLRKPLYIKDEDYRLSFLNGNYVTLANLKPAELKRIIKQRLSPLYISVHATNPTLREQLLGVTGIPPILEQLRALAEARIIMHTQIVLCPGLNDGAELERTIADLASLYPQVASVAIVPLGLTAHRQKLPGLTPVDTRYAAEFISVWQPIAIRLRKQLGEPFLFLADEFYLKGEIAFPSLREYGDFPQIENGVGMTPLFNRDAARVLKRARALGSFRVTVVTGHSIYPLVQEFVAELSCATGVDIIPVAVENRLFGPSVTVSGLIAGNDIVSALEGRQLGLALLVPDVMIKEGEGMFLDDVSVSQLEQRLGCSVRLFEATPAGFYKTVKSLSPS